MTWYIGYKEIAQIYFNLESESFYPHDYNTL